MHDMLPQSLYKTSPPGLGLNFVIYFGQHLGSFSRICGDNLIQVFINVGLYGTFFIRHGSKLHHAYVGQHPGSFS